MFRGLNVPKPRYGALEWTSAVQMDVQNKNENPLPPAGLGVRGLDDTLTMGHVHIHQCNHTATAACACSEGMYNSVELPRWGCKGPIERAVAVAAECFRYVL